MIDAAGWPIWLLIATSVLGLALIIERFLSLRRQRVVPSGLLDRLIDLARRGAGTRDTLERVAGGSPLGRVLAEVVAVRGESPDYRTAAIEEAGRDVAHELNRYIPALSTIAVVAPLMGLFGTVVGMIDIFGSYTPAGGDPAQLARGISIALYNTALGILIAIPALILHRYFRSRVEMYLHQMERQAGILNRILAEEPDRTEAGNTGTP